MVPRSGTEALTGDSLPPSAPDRLPYGSFVTSTAWIDDSAGVAGDVLLAACSDAGAAIVRVHAAIAAVLPEAMDVAVLEVHRAGLRAAKLELAAGEPTDGHRRWADIRQLLEQ